MQRKFTLATVAIAYKSLIVAQEIDVEESQDKPKLPEVLIECPGKPNTYWSCPGKDDGIPYTTDSSCSNESKCSRQFCCAGNSCKDGQQNPSICDCNTYPAFSFCFTTDITCKNKGWRELSAHVRSVLGGESRLTGQTDQEMGQVKFTEMCGTACGDTGACNGVCIEAKMVGLAPGDHGIHVRTWGLLGAADSDFQWQAEADCSAQALGDIWHRKKNRPDHAIEGTKENGSLGNLSQPATPDDSAFTTNVHCAPVVRYSCDEDLKLYGNGGIVGRSVVVYQNADDGDPETTDGNVGGPIACGTIEKNWVSSPNAFAGCGPIVPR